MRAIASIRSRFIASTRAVAAVEFAIILPILVTLFLASIDAGRAIAIYMKVRAATFTLAAITNQYTSVQNSDMASIVGATSSVLSPYSGTPAVVTISQISVNSASSATVSWSYSLNGTALTQGSAVTLPSTISTCGSYPCYLVYGQVAYTYTPMFGYFTSAPINMSSYLFVTPRSSQCVLYPSQNVTTCAASSGSSGSGSSGSGSSGSGSSGSGSSGSGSSGSHSGSSGSGSGGSGSSGSGSSGSGSSGSGSGSSGSGSGSNSGGGGLLCVLFSWGC